MKFYEIKTTFYFCITTGFMVSLFGQSSDAYFQSTTLGLTRKICPILITLQTNALLSRLRYYDFYAMNSAILIRHIIVICKLGFEFCIEKPLKNARMLKINARKICFNFNASKSFTIVTKDVAIGKT